MRPLRDAEAGRRIALARAERAESGFRMALSIVATDKWICEPLRRIAMKRAAAALKAQHARVEALGARIK